MKEPIRSFSLGLFTAGVIILVTYFFFDHAEKKAEALSTDEMIAIMKDEGYRVISESEYISFSVNNDASEKDSESKKAQDTKKEKNEKDASNENEKEKEEQAKEEQAEATKESPVITYTLHIKAGMPSSSIGNLLEENKIIKSGKEFNKYLEDEGYSLKVQLGDFKLTSDMSFYEIAEKIARQ